MMTASHRPIQPVAIGEQAMPAQLQLPQQVRGMVLLATGPAGGEETTGQLRLAAALRTCGLGTLRLELMAASQTQGRHPVLDLPLLGARVLEALRWLDEQRALSPLPLGILGMGQGASAALMACARSPQQVHAVVTHEGRPDLAGAHLRQVRAPALWITGARDTGTLELQRHALRALAGPTQLEVLGPSGQGQDGYLYQAAADLASQWFATHLPRPH